MKRLIYILTMFIGGACFAAPPVIEKPIGASNGAETVSVSTSAWTAGWSSSYAGMSGVYVTVRSTNTANMYMTIEASAPSASIVTGPIVLKPGISQFHNISEAMTVYFISAAAAAENVDILRVKQP